MAALCTSVFVLSAGCIFSPTKDEHKGGGGAGPYDQPTNPLYVLSNLQKAYKNRDSVYVKDIYDTTYVGQSTDLSDPPETQLSTFRWADEIAHVAALARSTTISSVDLDLGPQTSWTVINSDDPSHPEWAEIQINSWRVDIFDSATEYIVDSKNPTTFYFIPSVSGSGETTWKIVKWVEIGASQSGA